MHGAATECGCMRVAKNPPASTQAHRPPCRHKPHISTWPVERARATAIASRSMLRAPSSPPSVETSRRLFAFPTPRRSFESSARGRAAVHFFQFGARSIDEWFEAPTRKSSQTKKRPWSAVETSRGSSAGYRRREQRAQRATGGRATGPWNHRNGTPQAPGLE